jgi:DNA-binding XRE family transcriptional regulator
VTDRDILRRIGRNIREARLKAGMTQECLAELASVHWQTISGMERGRYPFSVVILHRISHFLQVSANRLLEGLPAPDAKRTEMIRKAMARKRAPKGDGRKRHK